MFHNSDLVNISDGVTRKVINQTPYSKAVVHVHTTHSDGLASPKEIVKACAKKKVKVLAITDHDTIRGVHEARKAGDEYGVDVICGEEIQTSLPRGLHIVGLFLKKAVPHSKSVQWTIDAIHKQGGLAIIAHPLFRVGPIAWPTGTFQMMDLVKLVERIKVDGIEVRYPALWKSDAKRLDKFYTNNNKQLGAKIGASDSHFGELDLFGVMTTFTGTTSGDLFKAIKESRTDIIEGETVPISLRLNLRQKKKALVDLGFRRYSKMVGRWAALNFGDKEEIVCE